MDRQGIPEDHQTNKKSTKRGRPRSRKATEEFSKPKHNRQIREIGRTRQRRIYRELVAYDPTSEDCYAGFAVKVYGSNLIRSSNRCKKFDDWIYNDDAMMGLTVPQRLRAFDLAIKEKKIDYDANGRIMAIAEFREYSKNLTQIAENQERLRPSAHIIEMKKIVEEMNDIQYKKPNSEIIDIMLNPNA